MTQTEINKLHKSIATDFKIIARKTELWDIQYCYQVLHDIKKLMVFGYIDDVSIVLNSVNGLALKAKKYRIGSTSRVQNDRPGGIDWEDGEGYGLAVVIVHTQPYLNLSPAQRQAFQLENLRIGWSPVNTDVNFPHLGQALSRFYTHETMGIDRIDFN